MYVILLVLVVLQRLQCTAYDFHAYCHPLYLYREIETMILLRRARGAKYCDPHVCVF